LRWRAARDAEGEGMSVPAGWEGILDEGEEILWQGRPDSAFAFQPRMMIMTVFGVFFAGFALFWMLMASMAGGYFWMFGLIHFAVGIGIVAGTLWGPTFRRRRTWYTLTDRRAFVATDLPLVGRRLKSYPITAGSVLSYDQQDPATIHFAHEMRRGRNGSTRVDVGFDRIHDGAEVYRLMRQVQRGQE
jgi:hypothetical protein